MIKKKKGAKAKKSYKPIKLTKAQISKRLAAAERTHGIWKDLPKGWLDGWR